MTKLQILRDIKDAGIATHRQLNDNIRNLRFMWFCVAALKKFNIKYMCENICDLTDIIRSIK